MNNRHKQAKSLLVAALHAFDELLIDFTIGHGVFVLPGYSNDKTPGL